VFAWLAACGSSTPAGSAGEIRGVLSLGLLPDENRESQAARYATLVDALESHLGFDVQLVWSASYDELVELFGQGKVDLAYFGGYTFLIANERHDAQPLVMRDIDARFVSQIVVREDRSELQQLADLRGSRFSFGARRSTSGHIMPRHHFSQLGVTPETFFSAVSYSGAHDRTVTRVADGTFDASVANGQIVRQLLSSATPPPVRIVWQSPPYVDYVWATQPSMTASTRDAIKHVFLSLSIDNDEDRRFLDSIGARYFIPASTEDFDDLRLALDPLRGEPSARSGG
jgi:phosphonate transport system substrate-binding protein